MEYYTTYNSPLGRIYLYSDGEYLTGLCFDKSLDMLKHKSNYTEKELNIFKETSKWLDIYFSGHNPDFTPKYKINNLTPFREKVINIIGS